MKSFGKNLFEFVEEALKEYPSYVLESLSVSAPDSGFDYAILVGKEVATLEALEETLTKDLSMEDISSEDIPVLISLTLRSKESKASLNRRYYEILSPEEDDEEPEEEPCCKKSCCKERCTKKEDSEESDEKEREMIREALQRALLFELEHLMGDNMSCRRMRLRPDEFFF